VAEAHLLPVNGLDAILVRAGKTADP